MRKTWQNLDVISHATDYVQVARPVDSFMAVRAPATSKVADVVQTARHWASVRHDPAWLLAASQLIQTCDEPNLIRVMHALDAAVKLHPGMAPFARKLVGETLASRREAWKGFDVNLLVCHWHLLGFVTRIPPCRSYFHMQRAQTMCAAAEHAHLVAARSSGRMPADGPKRCTVCGDAFEIVFDDDMNTWVYANCVGEGTHAECGIKP